MLRRKGKKTKIIILIFLFFLLTTYNNNNINFPSLKIEQIEFKESNLVEENIKTK